MPNEIRLGARRDWLGLRGSVWTVDEAELLLEVLLDICPNAYALAHNFLLERQKAEYIKGASGPHPPFDNHGYPCEPSGKTGELP